MVANIKKLFFLILVSPIYLYSNSTYANQNIVLQELINNVHDSRNILSQQIGKCLNASNSNLINLQQEKLLNSFDLNNIINFLKTKYHQNFTLCLNYKDQQYIYNLSKLYHAQKQYQIDTTHTLMDIENYFEPIEAIDKRIEYKNYSTHLKTYLNNLVGNKPFNIFEISKDISNYYNSKRDVK